jgi:class 3 adenylate cyclase
VVSAEVAELAGSERSRFEEVPAATLKGFDEPVRLFRLEEGKRG